MKLRRDLTSIAIAEEDEMRARKRCGVEEAQGAGGGCAGFRARGGGEEWRCGFRASDFLVGGGQLLGLRLGNDWGRLLGCNWALFRAIGRLKLVAVMGDELVELLLLVEQILCFLWLIDFKTNSFEEIFCY